MTNHLELVMLFLLIGVAGLTALAHAWGLPYPILLVLGGSAVGFAPGVPRVTLQPELVLLIFLPPLLFNAAYFSSFRELRENVRAISLNAMGLVALTTVAVASVAHATVDGLPWAAAFALGAIVSPTDPLAASAINARLGVPRRLQTVVEGEALVNDGSALVLYHTAVAAAVGGSFDAWGAAGSFVVNVVGGIAIGAIVGLLLIRVLTWIGDDAVVGVVVSLCCGYAGYLPAAEAGVSGVLAAVTVGLVVGYRSSAISSPAGRLLGSGFWAVLVFLLNAVLFLLVGLQLPGVLDAQSRSGVQLVGLGVLVSVTTVGVRLLWLNTAPHVPGVVDRRLIQSTGRAGWRQRTVVAWSGMRGAVSLAAALALPATVPERPLLIFLTLCVIFATLVGQGLTLPWVIRHLGVKDDGAGEREALETRRAAAEAALEELARLEQQDWTRPDTIERMRGMYHFRHRRALQRTDQLDEGPDAEDIEARSRDYQRVVRQVLMAQRRRVLALRDAGAIGDQALREVERELDLEESQLGA